MNDPSLESWEGGSSNGSKLVEHLPADQGPYNGQSFRVPALRTSDKPRPFADGVSDSFRSKAGAVTNTSRRHRAPVEVRAQAASELLAAEDPTGGTSSSSGGSCGSPTRTLPQRRHTMPASMLPPLVVPAFRPPLLWTDNLRSRGESGEASPGLTSPGHNKANGHMTSPTSQSAPLSKPHAIRGSIKLDTDLRHKPADISTTPGSPATVGKGPTGMQPSPMSPTDSPPTTARSVPSPADVHTQMFTSNHRGGAFVNSPDYSQAAGDLHFPSTVLLNRSLPTPGGLLRAQSMPAGVSKVGGWAKQELDPQGRVQELCGAARAGDHSMVRALLQGARSMDRVIDAVNEGTGLTALHEAVLGGHYDMVLHLLMDGEADPDTKRSSQGPPLLHAVRTNNEKMVDILLNAGAAVDARDLSDSTALHIAASMGHRKILKKLLTAGGNPALRNRDGRTPMDCAANEKTQHMFEKYLQHNPNVDLSEQSDVTPGSSTVGDAAWEGYSDAEARSRSVLSPPRGVLSPPSSHSHRGPWKPIAERPPKTYDASPRPPSKSKTFSQSSNSGGQSYSSSAPSQSHSSSVLSPPKSRVSAPNSYYANGGYDGRWKGQQVEPPQEENIHHSFDSNSSADTVQERPEENFLEEALSKVKEGKAVGINPSEAERIARGVRGTPQQEKQRRANETYEQQGGNRNVGRMRSISDSWERYQEQEAPPPRQYQNVPWAQIPLLRSLSGDYATGFQSSSSDLGGNEFGSQNRGTLSRTVSESMTGRFDMANLSRTLGTPPGYHHHSGSLALDAGGGRALAQTSYVGRDPWGGYLQHESWVAPSGGGRRSSEFHVSGGDGGHQFSSEGRPPMRTRQNSNPAVFYMDRSRGGDPPKLLERHASAENAKSQGFEAPDRGHSRGKSEPGISLATQSNRSRFGSPNSAFSAVGGERNDWQSSRNGRRSEGGLQRPGEWGGETENEAPNHSHRRSWDERASGDERDWLGRSSAPHQHDVSRAPQEGGGYWEAGSGRMEAQSNVPRARTNPPALELRPPFASNPSGSAASSPRARARVTEQVYLTPKPPATSHGKALVASPPSKAMLKEPPTSLLSLTPSACKPLLTSTPPAPKQAEANKAPPSGPADVSRPEAASANTPPPPETAPVSVKLTPAIKKPSSAPNGQGGSDSGGGSEGKAAPVKKGVQFNIDDIKLLRDDWQEAASKNGCVSCGKTECDGSCNPATKAKAVVPPSAQSLFDAAETKQTGSFVWTRGELLGEGAYGKVFAGLNQENGQLMAVKQLKLNDSDQSREYQRHVAALEREISLYRKMRHRHIVGYINMERDDASGSLYVFLEYVSGGSIHSMLERFGRFSEPLVRVYTRQLLQGLEYLHECKIIHRDIKGGNVLVDRDGVIKLADFGASKAFHDATLTDGCKSIRGSVFWMAPEVIKGEGYGRRADIWSVGCTVIEMLTGSHPWPGIDNTWTAIFHIAKALTGPPMPEIASPLARDFLNLCFALDPKERPTATDLLQHPFVAQATETAQAPVP